MELAEAISHRIEHVQLQDCNNACSCGLRRLVFLKQSDVVLVLQEDGQRWFAAGFLAGLLETRDGINDPTFLPGVGMPNEHNDAPLHE